MAKTYMGPNGGWIKKFGSSVGFRWKGIDVIRAYVKYVTNPNTDAQKLQREKISIAGKLAGALNEILNMTMRRYATEKKTTPAGQFVKQTLADAITGTLGNLSVQYDHVSITAPDAHLTEVACGEANFATPLTVTVPIDDSYFDNRFNSEEDKVYLVVYSKTAGQTVVSDGTAKRDSESVSVNVPGYWQGHFVEVFAFVDADPFSKRAGMTSPTIYCGSGRIA